MSITFAHWCAEKHREAQLHGIYTGLLDAFASLTCSPHPNLRVPHPGAPDAVPPPTGAASVITGPR
jgi:hypothetical protein